MSDNVSDNGNEMQAQVMEMQRIVLEFMPGCADIANVNIDQTLTPTQLMVAAGVLKLLADQQMAKILRPRDPEIMIPNLHLPR